jgi:hypothetical protein
MHHALGVFLKVAAKSQMTDRPLQQKEARIGRSERFRRAGVPSVHAQITASAQGCYDEFRLQLEAKSGAAPAMQQQ